MEEAGTRNVRNVRLHAEVFIEQYSKISDNTHWLGGFISDGEALQVIWNFLKIDGRTEVHAYAVGKQPSIPLINLGRSGR